MKTYVEQHDRGYWVAGTRVSLDSMVCGFLRGQSPESIVQSFPVLTLEEVYGAVTFYLANRAAVDACLQQGEADFERLRLAAREANPLLHANLEAARRSTASRRS